MFSLYKMKNQNILLASSKYNEVTVYDLSKKNVIKVIDNFQGLRAENNVEIYFLDDAEYEGSVLSLIENGESFIKRNNRMM